MNPIEESILFENINNYGHEKSGLIIEMGSIFEVFLNHSISTYFCNDENKMDDCNGFVQETSFKHRLMYYKSIVDALDKQLLTNTYDFRYIQNNDGILAKNIIDALNHFHLIRNKFAHGIISPLISESTESNLVFSVDEFKPRSNNGLKIEKPIYSSINIFSNKDYINLEHDWRIIRNFMSNFVDTIKSSCTRVPFKVQETK